MTREEAIHELGEWLEQMIQHGVPSHSAKRKALATAIALLSAEPNCGSCKHYEPKYDVCHAPELVNQVTSKLKNPCDSLLTDDNDDSKEQKSKLDLISRADAIEAVAQEWLSEASAESPYVNDDDIGEYRKLAEELFEDIPSAEADGEDLIIKGAKGIQDGLYNIKDGKLFKYKANGGTVRTYPILPSADAVSREMREPTEEERASVKRYIDNISADVVAVVRCKDCKHRQTDECPMYYEEWYEIDEGDGYADTDFIIHDYTRDDGFCHHGERREP